VFYSPGTTRQGYPNYSDFSKEKSMSSLQLYFALHMIGLVIWLGIALILPMVFIPAVKSLEESGQVKFMEVFTRKYIPWFVGAGLVVGITGLLQTLSPELWEEMDGNGMLILKHVVIIPLIASSIYVWFFLAKKLGKPETDKTKLWGQFVVFAWVQLTLSVAVLVITGMLTG
jgi:uncharacterized membrane protein